jgi:hypothetical protein
MLSVGFLFFSYGHKCLSEVRSILTSSWASPLPESLVGFEISPGSILLLSFQACESMLPDGEVVMVRATIRTLSLDCLDC